MPKKLVDFPVINVSEDDTEGRFLVEFYKKIGWNGTDYINSTSIQVHPEQWKEFCQVLINVSRNSEINLTYMWLNQGPSSDQREKVPYGKVLLTNDCFVSES